MKPSDNEIEMLAAGFAIQHKNGLIRFAHALLDKYAPQANAEDVHNAALEEAAKEMDRLHAENRRWHNEFREAAAVVRALKQPQADKDGGQQHAGDAERWRWATATDENAQMLYTIVQAYGGDQQKINERADFYRAALSAPQAEQGERDAQD